MGVKIQHSELEGKGYVLRFTKNSWQEIDWFKIGLKNKTCTDIVIGV